MSKSQLKRAKMKANAAKKADEEAKKAAEEEAARQEELAKKNGQTSTNKDERVVFVYCNHRAKLGL